MNLIHFFGRMFRKIKYEVKARPKATLHMKVTRADGSEEYYVADEKGQRRIK